MTKEEYEEKLAKQFEEEETLTPAPTTSAAPEATDVATPPTEPATAPEAKTPPADTGSEEKPADAPAEGDKATAADAAKPTKARRVTKERSLRSTRTATSRKWSGRTRPSRRLSRSTKSG